MQRMMKIQKSRMVHNNISALMVMCHPKNLNPIFPGWSRTAWSGHGREHCENATGHQPGGVPFRGQVITRLDLHFIHTYQMLQVWDKEITWQFPPLHPFCWCSARRIRLWPHHSRGKHGAGHIMHEMNIEYQILFVPTHSGEFWEQDQEDFGENVEEQF